VRSRTVSFMSAGSLFSPVDRAAPVFFFTCSGSTRECAFPFFFLSAGAHLSFFSWAGQFFIFFRDVVEAKRSLDARAEGGGDPFPLPSGVRKARVFSAGVSGSGPVGSKVFFAAYRRMMISFFPFFPPLPRDARRVPPSYYSAWLDDGNIFRFFQRHDVTLQYFFFPSSPSDNRSP